MTNHWLWFFAFITLRCAATELMYTVTHCTINDQLLQFIMHQKSVDCLELWIHNEHTGDRYKALSNFYTPVAVRLLPDLTGFSFLHNDAVYIKYFNKRSPKRIDFYEPLYGISTIEWLDAEHFYFAAREDKRFRIYESDLEGNVDRIISNDEADALYPQMINNELFYIERTDQKIHSIIKTSPRDANKNETLLALNKPIAFLKMVTANKGFFLVYPMKISVDQEVIKFSYYQLLKQDDDWQHNWLLDFKVPIIYLTDGPGRVYESIVPFLPVLEN